MRYMALIFSWDLQGSRLTDKQIPRKKKNNVIITLLRSMLGKDQIPHEHLQPLLEGILDA